MTCPEVVIKHDGESVVSVATQTSDHSDQVQINVPLEELLKRVEAFTQLKRRQIDASNQIEFCCCSNPDTSCARTDAAYVKRSPHQVSHIPSTKVRKERKKEGEPSTVNVPIGYFQYTHMYSKLGLRDV